MVSKYKKSCDGWDLSEFTNRSTSRLMSESFSAPTLITASLWCMPSDAFMPVPPYETDCVPPAFGTACSVSIAVCPMLNVLSGLSWYILRIASPRNSSVGVRCSSCMIWVIYSSSHRSCARETVHGPPVLSPSSSSLSIYMSSVATLTLSAGIPDKSDDFICAKNPYSLLWHTWPTSHSLICLPVSPHVHAVYRGSMPSPCWQPALTSAAHALALDSVVPIRSSVPRMTSGVPNNPLKHCLIYLNDFD